jgi:hypothetical protein
MAVPTGSAYRHQTTSASPVPCDLAVARDALTRSFSFALRFNGRKRMHDAGEAMAPITAERLVEHFERSGYVVMHKPPLGPHEAPGHLAGWIEKATKTDRGE